MRRITYGIAALVLTASLAVAGSALAKTAIITVDGQVGGKETPKFDKKKFKGTADRHQHDDHRCRQSRRGCRRR